MSSDEILIAEAVASLTARLDAWGLDDPAAKAHEFITDMLRHGWRARALPSLPPNTVTVSLPPNDTYRQARESLRRQPTTEGA